MSGFFRSSWPVHSEIFTESKNDKPDDKKATNKLEQQSMYDFNSGPSEKVSTPAAPLFKSNEAEQAQPTSQPSKSAIKEKPSMFSSKRWASSEMKVKTKDDKKPEYEPVLIPEQLPAERKVS